jgi:hypothetical protein
MDIGMIAPRFIFYLPDDWYPGVCFRTFSSGMENGFVGVS